MIDLNELLRTELTNDSFNGRIYRWLFAVVLPNTYVPRYYWCPERTKQNRLVLILSCLTYQADDAREGAFAAKNPVDIGTKVSKVPYFSFPSMAWWKGKIALFTWDCER